MWKAVRRFTPVILCLAVMRMQARSGGMAPDVYDLASVQEQPVFPGGLAGLMSFITGALHYPDSAIAHQMEGKVFVEFIVEKDGRVSEAKIERGVDPYLNAEALRVVRSMPPWSPGIHDGKPVRVKFMLPLVFKLT